MLYGIFGWASDVGPAIPVYIYIYIYIHSIELFQFPMQSCLRIHVFSFVLLTSNVFLRSSLHIQALLCMLLGNLLRNG